MRRLRRGPLLGACVLAGAGVVLAAREVTYVNWRPVVPPLDGRPLTIRHDAKGDGRFLSPRSGNRLHRGVDLAAELNAPVRAIRSGRVVQAGEDQGLGSFVELEHRPGLHSLYAHLGEIRVREGKRVRQGAVIGLVGKTGNARHPWIAPHLHLEVLEARVPINPETLGLQVAGGAAADPGTEDESHASGGE